MKIFTPLITVLLLTSCAARQNQTYDIYGNQAYHIQCSTGAKVMCVDQANKTCPKGYYLVDEDDTSSILFNSLTVRCK